MIQSDTHNDHSKKQLIIWSIFLLLTLVWGSSFILVKRALQGGFTASEVASIRMVAALAVLAIPAIRWFGRIPREKRIYVAISGWLSMMIPAFLFSAAQVHIDSSVAGILNALTPTCTFIVGITAFRQPINKMQTIGLIIGFVGSVILVLVNAKGELSLNRYALLVIAATLCYGINVNMVKHRLADVRSLYVSAGTVAVAGGTAGLYMLASGSVGHIASVAAAHPMALAAALTLGALGSAVAQVAFNYMLTLTSSVFASSITYFIPIVAILWGVMDGEVLLAPHYIGMACIIGGILILNKFR